jgi:hypothetical protein
MAQEPQSLGTLFGDYEAELLAAASTPDAQAQAEADAAHRTRRAADDFERGVRLGWHDADGNALPHPEDEPCGECGEAAFDCECEGEPF